jgi:hypothetical protein
MYPDVDYVRHCHFWSPRFQYLAIPSTSHIQDSTIPVPSMTIKGRGLGQTHSLCYIVIPLNSPSVTYRTTLLFIVSYCNSDCGETLGEVESHPQVNQ